MKLIFKILPLAFLFLFHGKAYQQEYNLLKHINVQGNYMTVDDLGNIFLVNHEKLTKLDDNGKILYTYSDLYNGNISFVDPGDPFKILVYYHSFSQIVFLDKFLSKTTDPVNLETLGLELSTLACGSYNNGFWVFLPQRFELVRVDQEMTISNRSGDISKIVHDEIEPNYLLEKNNMVYLNDPGIGIMIFDKYGTYYKTIPLKQLEYFRVEGDNIIYQDDKKMKVYSLKSLDSSYIDLPGNNIFYVSIKYSFNPKRLYLLSERGIDIYYINLNKK